MLRNGFILFLICLSAQHLNAQRVMENLGRGLVATREAGGKVFISWRLLASEPFETGFNIYRSTGKEQPKKINKLPVTSSTCFTDSLANSAAQYTYFVKKVQGGKESAGGKSVTLKPGTPAYLSIPLQTPDGYSPNDASAGDLDGDGEYEIVLHQVGRSRDNASNGFTDPPIFQAYKMDGKLLWTINLGKNIREGAHYTQFMVYDLDGDGKAEIAMKTADGTIDGKG